MKTAIISNFTRQSMHVAALVLATCHGALVAIELAEVIYSPGGPMIVEMAHNAAAPAWYEALLCASFDHEPEVCFEGTKTLSVGLLAKQR
jgi:hypothetical protein